ncbi:MAG TPA: lysylphosphatidylglycerol synthase transmembrane domain-containing protein [Flavobacterium sp.]|uniref:lysylphosphatidylglycerol synthase transmembrane domain-containing protein n=1 Tax=Flavobacterium sp. TaxID=239 RepID=UPI002CF64FAF|nr:lysylphosphatidylglycerol synthase transmembrane domain-containing protein [Flavobacterium sp.]HSD14474.1 lysylphosphatidylglycerol synthase transmembrane domain-containing protein [Flavobacterium sp.]
MNEKIKKTLGIALPLLLGVFLVFYTYNKFTDQQLDEMKGYFKNADYSFIAISSFFSVVSLAARGYRWRYTLEQMGYLSNFPNNFSAVCIGYLMNYTVPRSGEVSRALVLKKYNDIPFDKAFGTIIAERVIDLFILIGFILTALILQFDQLQAFLSTIIPVEKLIYVGFIGAFGFISVVLLFIYSNWKPIVFIKEKIAGLIEGLLSAFKMPHRIPFMIYTAVIWISYVLTFYSAVFALPETSSIGLGVIITAFVVGSLAVTFTNGGFGAFPLMIAQILLLYNIPETAGTAFGWILWSSQTALVVLLGGISFLLLPVFNRKK